MSMCENDGELNIYETGRTQPPKNRHGTVAVVLIAAIFICGILRGSYLLNIPLIRLELPAQQEDLPVRFARSPKLEAAQIPAPSAPVCADVSVELSAAANVPAENIRQSTVTVTCRTDTGTATAGGIILSENGYVLTPCHILQRAISVTLELPDGRQISAAVVGMDRMTNLAVLYAPCSDLIPADFGDSGLVRVGDTATDTLDGNGVITQADSLLLSTVRLSFPGAPLLNAQGQIIGIRTAPDDCYRAVPSAVVKEIADQLAQRGFVANRPDPGFSCTELTQLDRNYYGLPQGLYITSVYTDNGLQPGDIVQTFDGVPIHDPETFYRTLYTHRVGDSVTLSLIREGKPETLALTLQEAD